MSDIQSEDNCQKASLFFRRNRFAVLEETRSLARAELGIDYNKFNAIIRKLKDLGILTRNSTFSEVFQDKTTTISTFYGQYTGKANPVQKALDDANEYLKAKGYSGRFEPQYKTSDDEPEELEETGQ